MSGFSLGMLKYVYGKCECFVRQMLYVCVLCASCCVLHDLQFVNAGQGCNRRAHGRVILQSRSHYCLVGSHEWLLLFTPSCCVGAIIICRGVCACAEMLWMCVMYVSFGSKIRPRTFGCVAIDSAVLFILRYNLQSLEWTECKLFCWELAWDCYVLSRLKL